MSFWPGQRVECVAPGFRIFPEPNWLQRLFPRKKHDPQHGRVYVVSGVSVAYGHVLLDIVGFPGSRYSAHGFRPIVETEIEKLREIAAQPELTEMETC